LLGQQAFGKRNPAVPSLEQQTIVPHYALQKPAQYHLQFTTTAHLSKHKSPSRTSNDLPRANIRRVNALEHFEISTLHQGLKKLWLALRPRFQYFLCGAAPSFPSLLKAKMTLDLSKEI
jgi:hypothetical protein